MIIYKITNLINGKIYVGKTTKTAEERFKRHYYNHKSGNTYLYRSMRKYGFDSFVIETIEQTNQIDEREKFWITELAPHYNMTKGGDGGDTSNSPNFIEGIKKRPPPPPTYGMLGKKQSDRFFEAIRKSNSRPVMCEGKRYASINEAQEAYPGISIRKRLSNLKYPEFYRLEC